MERKIDSFSWQELERGYRQYAKRLEDIHAYGRIARDKKPLSDDMPIGQEEYLFRLQLDEGLINKKMDVIADEVLRRRTLIGGVA